MQKIIKNESRRKCILPEHPIPKYYLLIWFNADVGIVCLYVGSYITHPFPTHAYTQTHVRTHISTIAGIKDYISVHFTISKLDEEKGLFLRENKSSQKWQL